MRLFLPDSKIEILGNKISTHGYLLQAIDYGMVLHKKYLLENWEKMLLSMIMICIKIIIKLFSKIMLKNLIEKYPNVDINKIVTISKEDKITLGKYLSSVKIDDSKWIANNYKYFEELLYKILFFDKFQTQCGIEQNVKLFEFIPIASVIFILENFYNLKKILEHLIGLRN